MDQFVGVIQLYAHFPLCCQCDGSSCSRFSGLPKTIHCRKSVNKAQWTRLVGFVFRYLHIMQISWSLKTLQQSSHTLLTCISSCGDGRCRQPLNVPQPPVATVVVGGAVVAGGSEPPPEQLRTPCKQRRRIQLHRNIVR